MTEQAPLIRASELSQYAFCHRAWWLATVQGQRPADPDALEFGRRHHRRHGLAVAGAIRRRKVGLALMLSGGALCVGLALALIGMAGGGG